VGLHSSLFTTLCFLNLIIRNINFDCFSGRVKYSGFENRVDMKVVQPCSKQTGTKTTHDVRELWSSLF